jgi:hypothetical protein
MPQKKGSGQFVKDAISEEFLEVGFDKVYKLSLSTTEQFVNPAKQNALDPTQTGIENRFIQMNVQLGHESVMKILKLLNPKRVNWQMGEPPTKEDKEKYGIKARWKWSDYDPVQLKLVSGTK